jgi:acetoin:2,6-dichlorophenolindophenol oxidoreductase subunit alpha
VFVCENNLYMEYMSIADITALACPAADRAAAYGLPPVSIDGNDADECYARAGGGPSLIEAVTYRHGGHSRADPGKYRPAGEVAAGWPTTLHRSKSHRCTSSGVVILGEGLGRRVCGAVFGSGVLQRHTTTTPGSR